MKQIAIVTGASSGLGREFVRLLLRQEDLDEIWILARHADRLRAMQADCPEKLRAFPADLSDRAQIAAFSEALRAAGVRVRLLINNAGFAKFGSYRDVSLGESLNMIDLNASGVVAMGLVCLPYMDRGGRILNIASQAAFLPLPYLNVYAATKAFVHSYSRALNAELRGRGITVTAVCPGWMQTGFQARGLTGAKKQPRVFSPSFPPRAVAAQALRDAEKGRDVSVYGAAGKLIHLGTKLLPQRAAMRLWRLQQGL